MYAVRAQFSASSIRAAMRAVPFFFDVTMWKPFVRRRDFPFSPSIESIERNREEIDLASPRNRSISDRNEEKRNREIYTSIEQIVFSIRRTEASLSRFTVVSSPTSVAIDVAPMISISRWFPSAHMRLRLAIKDTPIKEINTREIARAAEV